MWVYVSRLGHTSRDIIKVAEINWEMIYKHINSLFTTFYLLQVALYILQVVEFHKDKSRIHKEMMAKK